MIGKSTSLAVAALLASGIAGAPAFAQSGRVAAEYQVTFLGLPIGTGSMTSTTDGTTYRTQLSARVSGVAQLFASGSGNAEASGRVVGAAVQPQSFSADIRTRGQTESTRINIAGGAVRNYSRTPEKPYGDDVVPLTPDMLRGVVDPLSAGIFVAAGTGPVTGPSACQRRSRIFNGRERFDLIFSFKETRKVDIAGYKGEAAVCNVRFEPVAGYRRDRKDLVEAGRRDAEVVLVPIAGQRTLLPARITIPTGFGSGVATATRLELDPGLPVRRAAAD